ncbi:MAG: hypothetical protein II909_00390 [Kiritimatiellae bacterium]|nr:hypothetical protein [Kiritimatiellia bacterium]
MKLNTIMALAAAASISGMAFAQEQETAPATAETQPAAAEEAAPAAAAETPAEEEQLDEEECSIVSAEFGLAFDSKYLTYGVVDGKDPIVTPSATVTFFDTLYFGVEAIFDVTKGNGKRGDYGRRAGQWTTLDAIVGVTHDFDLGDTLGALTVDVNYIYEYIRRYKMHNAALEDKSMDDTQYVNLELSLGDLWFEPTLAIERDIMADNGTYVNLEVGHTFTVIGEEDDPVVTLRPAVGQGWGNSLRTHGYFADSMPSESFSHGGLMDTSFSLTAEWAICEYLTLSGYVAYYDYLFDSTMRDAARYYNGGWNHRGRENNKGDSAQFVGGLALTASF